jgi:hypothetical protein
MARASIGRRKRCFDAIFDWKNIIGANRLFCVRELEFGVLTLE